MSIVEHNLTFTDSAIERIREMQLQGSDQIVLRITVKGGGCSGMEYDFKLDEYIEREDLNVIGTEDIADNEDQGSDDNLLDDLDDQIVEDYIFRAENSIVFAVVDTESLEYLRDCIVDYEVTLTGSTFKIYNPRAKATCGCGNSFAY